MEWRRETAQVQENNLRSYLATGDPSPLNRAQLFEIPYSDASRLRQLLDAPEIHAALPPELLSRDTPPNWVEAIKRTFLAQGYTLLGAGIVLLLLTVISRIAAAPAFEGPHPSGGPIRDFRKASPAPPSDPVI